jgi:Uma2 family endonuclease
MSIITQTIPAGFGMPPGPVRKFTVAEYHQMIQSGLLTENDPVELLEGWLVPKMGRNPPHDGCVEATEEAIRSRLPAGWRVRGQSAVTLPDSEPEPDVAVVRGTVRANMGHHPIPAEIALLVEVSDSSLAYDRTDKGRAYARSGIVLYWIVNLVDMQVEVYSDPTGPDANPRYRQRQDYDRNADVPLVIGGVTVGQVPVRELLP